MAFQILRVTWYNYVIYVLVVPFRYRHRQVGLLAPALVHHIIASTIAIQQVDRAGINVVIDLAADPALAARRLGTMTGAYLLGNHGVDERPHAVRVVDLPIGAEQVEVVGRSETDGARRPGRGDRSVLLVLDAAATIPPLIGRQ